MAIPSNVDQLFAQGVQFHSEGQLPQALQAYEQVLQLDPGHFDALHNTGIAAFQSGNFDAAAGFIRSALAVNPEHANALNNLGNALREMQQLEEALRSYDRALTLAPADANTHFNRAVTLQSLMRSAEALQAYEQALNLDAGDDQAWSNRAALLWQTGQYDLALVNTDQALVLNPQNIEALNHRGNILQDQGQHEQAEQSYRQALALYPEYADAHYNLGRLLLAGERHADALQHLDQAVSLHPQHVQAHRQRALTLRVLQQAEQAQQAEATALQLQRELVAAYRQRGAELEQQLQHASAAAMYAAALELDGGDAELQQLHTRALDNSSQHEEVRRGLREVLRLKTERAAQHGAPQAAQPLDAEAALAAFEKLALLAPDNPGTYVNLALLLSGLDLRDQALARLDQALAIAPDSPIANVNKGLLLLARGDYERGWAGYEWRWHAPELATYKTRRRFVKPQWSGSESLQGKTILLHAEQGLGDALQFCRYAALAKQRGARVVMEVWGTLAPLMASLDGVDQIVIEGDALPAFDYHIPLMSLAGAFNTRVDSVPAPASYLRADAAKRDAWAALLGPKTRPRIGIVWSGSATHANDHNRSLPLSVLTPLISGQYEFISLQKDVRTMDQRLLDTLPIRQVAGQIKDFSDTAALCELMDVVLTVDTSVAHLAGALGKPVWIMLPKPFEWRWLEQGETSPWYPSAKLYRQQQMGDWEPVIAAVAADLNTLPGAGGMPRFQLHTN
ncbi:MULTISPECIES: tetratricopeptide repeat protein [unclassified Duganella]|uniref:tetratricopeptide repeat protein n=1 Tax=unclassified Duganella TaxID=2636909 RepID=UPI00087E1061|nr:MULTISPECIES: tetratricopeptide repeat protein [unclassified Duganella]SDF68902.1 Tfp pilus assembly protein PilF [Duganella sp. OV458]SDI60419.1 Tfp pilus assembly protein PilF [Duganella sp. OV510]